jgi:hypothetical protein
MSQMLKDPTSLLHKHITFSFEIGGERKEEYAYVQTANTELLGVLINPKQGDKEFYAELYLEDNPTVWYIVEIH